MTRGDDDYTGSDRSRPEFLKLISDAKQRKFDIVLCKSQSRFTRELELVEKYIHGLFAEWGIRFIGLADSADTSVKGNKKSRQINGLVNEWYLEDMSENIKTVLTSKRKQGLHIGAFALYGYKKDSNNKGHLIIDEEAAFTVRLVFELFTCGMGKTDIARYLNEHGVPNPTEYRKRAESISPQSKTSGLWQYFSVANMLKNEMYIGNMVQGKYGSVSYKSQKNKPKPRGEWIRVEGTHQPIINLDVWNRAQALLKERSKPFCGNKAGIFAGKVRCADCGYVMRSCKSRGKSYFRCSRRFVSKDACNGAFIPQEKLESAICEQLAELSKEYLDIDALKNKICEQNNRQNPITVTKKALSAKLAENENHKKAIGALYLDRAGGVIDETMFCDMLSELQKSKSNLECECKRLETELNELQAREQDEYNRERLIAEHLKKRKLSRLDIVLLIDKILVEKRKKGGSYHIEIHWNF